MIRLQSWEYDLIRYEVSKGAETIATSDVLRFMSKLGYFEGVNPYMPLVDILVVAEIVS